jgi:hypothetical protein
MEVTVCANGLLKVNGKYYVRIPSSWTSDSVNDLGASCTCPNAYGKQHCEHIKAAYEHLKQPVAHE